MRKVSLKLAKKLREYSKKKRIHLAQFPYCQASLKVCDGMANQIHHIRGRVGNLLTDERHFLAVCDSCHRWIENNVTEAKQLGLSGSRLEMNN